MKSATYDQGANYAIYCIARQLGVESFDIRRKKIRIEDKAAELAQRIMTEIGTTENNVPLTPEELRALACLPPQAREGCKMTLKEAIVHCHQVVASAKDGECYKCAADHLQLAKWLEELVELRQTSNDPLAMEAANE